jgi:glycosyltransferase involved in cell wall biosynthesis
MRILWLSKVPPDTHAPRTWQFARRLSDRGHDVRILTARIEPDAPTGRMIDGLAIRAVRTAPVRVLRHRRLGFYASRLPWYAWAPVALRRMLRAQPTDVVVEDLAPVGAAMVDLACRGVGVPLVIDVHYLLGQPLDWLRMYGPIGLWGAAYERRLLGGGIRPAALVSDSRPLVERVTERRPELPSTWIPSGVDGARFTASAGSSNGTLEALAVGRLAPPKGHASLIDAMTRLSGQQAIHLTIVGDGPLAATLERMIGEAGIGDRVSLGGRVPYERLEEVYRAADIFVMPSLAEGLPLAMVEAMASGLAIVATDIPEHRQVADETAIRFVPPGDPAALARAIDDLAADEASRRSMAARARRIAEERFDWGTLTDAFEDVLRRATHEPRRR